MPSRELLARCNQRGICRGCHVVERGGAPRDLLACQHHLADGDTLRIGEVGAALLLRAEAIELNLDPGFEDRYLDHLSLA
ncbi:MAG: hypothetical protein NTV93_02260 [Verrucomicrobia bacterium]|nr:hypothetical protein [Verrucomicrobiota bacterium]